MAELMGDFHGEPAGVLENESLSLEYLLNSLRIVRLTPTGKPNLFADLGKESISTPYGDFYFRGGHRLWHAPEAFPRSYVPDNEGAIVDQIENGVRLRQPAGTWSQIAKTIEVVLHPDAPEISVKHKLRNEGTTLVDLAPWALTMMRLGGTAIVPQATGNVDEAGLLPNRNLVLWPYTQVNDPRIALRDDFILVRADVKVPALKLGCLSPQGWIGYWVEGNFFVKRFNQPQPAIAYPDHGCNVEIYCNDKFIELETLGPLINLEPGATVSHTEVWEIYNTLKLDWIPLQLQKILSDEG